MTLLLAVLPVYDNRVGKSIQQKQNQRGRRMDARLWKEDKNALGNSFNAARQRGSRLAGKQNNGRRQRDAVRNIAVGVIGSCVSGLLFGLLGFSAHSLFEHHCFGGGGVRVPVRGAQADKMCCAPPGGERERLREEGFSCGA